MKLLKNIIALACFGIFSLQAMEAKKEQLLATYNKPLASSPEVIDCFRDITQSKTEIAISRGLFPYLCSQAALDSNFKPTNFCTLMQEIEDEEDRVYEYARTVYTKHAAAFYNLLKFIPWNGKIYKDMFEGIASHSILLNGKGIMNVGFRLNQARKKDEYSSVEVSANLFFDDPEIIEAYKKLLVAAGVQKKNEYSSIIANHSFDDSMIEIGKKLLEAAQKKSSL